MDRYTFESRESYEKAVKEEELIQQLKKKADLKNNKTVLKLYNKLVAEKTFSTVIGYDFLEELRTQILKSGLVSEELLPEIPVKVPVLSRQRTLTRASASMDSISCTRAFFRARRPTPRMKETLVRRTSPSGIMPRTPATVPTRAAERVLPE